jgi:anti-sigma B factor antagonist
MKILIDFRDDVYLITVSGRVDSNTSPELSKTLTKRAEQKKHVVVNLHNVDYLSSAGVRALVSALRICDKHRRKFFLTQLSARVSEVIDLAGLRSVFEIYDSNGAALGVLNLNE